MKQVRKTLKVKDAETAATFFYENEIAVILSWLETELFDEKIVVILVLAENKVQLLNQQTYLK